MRNVFVQGTENIRECRTYLSEPGRDKGLGGMYVLQ